MFQLLIYLHLQSTDKPVSVPKGEKSTSYKGDRHSAASKLDAASRQNDDDIMRTLLMVESKKKQDRTVPSQSSVATTDPWGNPSASAWGNEEPESSKAYDASSSDSEDDESSFAQPRMQIPPPVQSGNCHLFAHIWIYINTFSFTSAFVYFRNWLKVVLC